MVSKPLFETGYFCHSKISNYEDYRGKKFGSQSEELMTTLDMGYTDVVVDFGCATGGLLYEFKRKGFTTLRGTDISYWAIDFGKKAFQLDMELDYYNINVLDEEKDWLFLLDVLEHIHTVELERIMEIIKNSKVHKGIIMRVPVSAREGGDFVLDVSKNDKTHIQIHSKTWWIKLFKKHGLKLKEELDTDTIYSSDGVLAGWFVK